MDTEALRRASDVRVRLPERNARMTKGVQPTFEGRSAAEGRAHHDQRPHREHAAGSGGKGSQQLRQPLAAPAPFKSRATRKCILYKRRKFVFKPGWRDLMVVKVLTSSARRVLRIVRRKEQLALM